MSATKILNKFPNQRVANIKHTIHTKNNLFYTAGLEATDRALSELSGNAFKLYMYLNKNKQNYNALLSFQEIHKACKMAKQTYTNAFAELEEHGYLVLKDGTKTIYTFYENPDLANEENDTLEIEVKEETADVKVKKKPKKKDDSKTYSDEDFKAVFANIHHSMDDFIVKEKEKPIETFGNDDEMPEGFF